MRKNKFISQKKKNQLHILNIILYLFLFTLLFSFIFIYSFNKKIGPSLINCAENEVRHLTSLLINNSIKNYNKNLKTIDLLEINYNNKKEITLIRYNINNINKITSEITEIIENDLQKISNGNIKELNLNTITDDYYEKIKDGIVLAVPIGSATGNNLLANLGPKIPLKLVPIGNVLTNIKSNVSEYGLNNAMIEIYANIKVTIVIQMPFLSKEITIKNKVPITTEIIQGNVPEYYTHNK